MVIDSTDQHVAMDQHDDQLKQANRWDRANKETIDKKMDTQPAATTLPSLMQTTFNVPPGATPTAAAKPAEEVWVENKTPDSRTYYYNARTRESSWTKPVASANVKVISQEDVERMAAVNNQLQQVAAATKKDAPVAETNGKPDQESPASSPTSAEPILEAKKPPAATPAVAVPPFNPFTNGPPPFMGAPPGLVPPAGVNGPPPGFPPFMAPPGGFPGMPNFPGMPPFGMPPFGMPGMPPFGGMPFATTGSSPSFLDDSKYYYTEEVKKEVRQVESLLSACKEHCASFSEYESQDGKKYYHNAKTNTSVWDKPQCLTDLPVLEKKLEELKKKRIEKPVEVKKSAHVKAAEKESELTEEEKAKQRSKPISSTAVPGTPWCVVWTRDKRVFFYNPSEKVSLWERPQVLVGRNDVDKLVREPPAGAVADLAAAGSNVSTLSSTSSPSNANSNVNNKNNNSNVKKKPGDIVNAEPPFKKHKSLDDDSNGMSPNSGSHSPSTDKSLSPCPSPSRQAMTEEFLQKEKIEASKEAAIEAEHKAAQVRKELPLEQRMEQFKEMLIEKEISAYSTWEKELQKIVFDPRYLLLTSKERKQVFERYVRDRAAEESKERATIMKRKKDDYRELLKEANITSKSNFSDFSIKYARDERFKTIEKLKERESLFNDYQSDLRKAEKEEKYAEKERLKKAFICLLKEQKQLHRSSSWSETKKLIDSDVRYKEVDSSSRREDYFRDYVRYLDDKPVDSDGEQRKNSSHRDKDRDHKRKDKSSKKDSDDQKLKNSDSTHASDVASENMSEPGAIEDTDDDTTQNAEEKRKEKEKRDRIEASLSQRNKEVKEQLSKYQNEREKERDLLKLDESIECFKALLLDIIKPSTVSEKVKESKDGEKVTKPSEMNWKEAKKILKRDSRWSYCKVLEKEKKEQLFDEHMDKFRAKKREMFYQLLDETTGVTLSSGWKEVKKLIKSDTRYEKLQQTELIKLEKEFDNYINEKYQTAKRDFQELLMQTKLITYKSAALIKESTQASQNHVKEIEEILGQDKSWIVMECAADERKKLLDEYIEKLHNEGPPPPPTATEPLRRK